MTKDPVEAVARSINCPAGEHYEVAQAAISAYLAWLGENGWGVKPLEPTPEMIEKGAYMCAKTAADWLGDRIPETFDMSMSNAVATATYKAFIAAAPPPPGEPT